MAKARGEDPAGGMYHVYARGNDGRVVFEDDADRVAYLGLLREVVGRDLFRCLAYCLMTNHVHLVVETDGGSLGDGMRRLHGQYARAFNRRHRRTGHLFGSRFGSTAILDDGHACMALRYVARNPVEAGLCGRPEDWVWSSCAQTLAGTGPSWLATARTLAVFDWLGGEPRRRFGEIVVS